MPTRNEILAVRSLRHKVDRYTERKFVVEGQKCVTEALSSGWKVHGLYVTENMEDAAWTGAERVSAKEMDRMSQLKSAPGLLAVVGMPEPTAPSPAAWSRQSDMPPISLALDGLSDPGNLGTIIRTADWFGIAGIWSAKGGVDPFNPKVVQASMGAVFRVNVWEVDLPETLRELNECGVRTVAMAMDGPSLWQEGGAPSVEEKWLGVVGSESHGLSPGVAEACSSAVHIPGGGASESLNASVAAGMVLGHWMSKQDGQASTGPGTSR